MQNRFNNDKVKTLSNLPNPSVFIDMQKAVLRVSKAVNSGEKISLIGDYDVDGVTSCALMKIFFDQINVGIDVIIPNRFTDGYGLSDSIAKKIDSGLVITVDNGISAISAIDILNSKGCEVIIIDHHTPPDKAPDVHAIVHPVFSEPKLNVTDICAALVTWYFLAALKNELKSSHPAISTYDMKKLLHLVAIATIADVMPLVCINRAVVRNGLDQLNTSDMPFARVLRDNSKKKFLSDDVAFKIAPRLNSAGRMSDATIAFEFLSANNISLAAKKLDELNSLNESRREVESKIYEAAISQIDGGDMIAVVYGDDWHEGVLGIVASRIVQNFKKPAIVLSVKDSKAKGSARSIGNVNIYEILKHSAEMLSTFGGHRAAAGLSLPEAHLFDFRQRVNSIADKIDKSDFFPKAEYLGQLNFDSIDLELCDILEEFEPYGQHNEKPKFFVKNAVVEKCAILGKDQNVLKLSLKHDGSKKVDAIYFGAKNELNLGDSLSFTYSVVKNTFNQESNAQVVISEFLD